jgi:hypothetical protein
MRIWMESVEARSQSLERKALAKGMNAPRSRCHGTFIHYSNGQAWCLTCYRTLKRGWPER